LTAQGSPRVIFKRAIERGNVLIADTTAREFALNLRKPSRSCFSTRVRAYEPAKLERAALRWFGRFLDEATGVSLLKAQLALAALGELRGREHERAAKLLTELSRRSAWCG